MSKKLKTVREMCEEAGISQRAAARALVVNERTFRRWCQEPGSDGYIEAPYAAAELLRRMIAAGEITSE